MQANRRYYELCVGHWEAPLDFQLTSVQALMASPLTLQHKVAMLGLAMMLRLGLRPMLRTSVTMRGPDEAVHTTEMYWLGVRSFGSTESIRLDANGCDGVLHGEQRVAPLWWQAVPCAGTVQINEAADAAHYKLQWLGDALEQRTLRSADVVDLEQHTSWFHGRQRLQRVG